MKYVEFKYEPLNDQLFEDYGTLEVSARVKADVEDFGYYAGQVMSVEIVDLQVFDQNGTDITASIEDSYADELECIIATAYTESEGIDLLDNSNNKGEYND